MIVCFFLNLGHRSSPFGSSNSGSLRATPDLFLSEERQGISGAGLNPSRPSGATPGSGPWKTAISESTATPMRISSNAESDGGLVTSMQVRIKISVIFTIIGCSWKVCHPQDLRSFACTVLLDAGNLKNSSVRLKVLNLHYVYVPSDTILIIYGNICIALGMDLCTTTLETYPCLVCSDSVDECGTISFSLFSYKSQVRSVSLLYKSIRISSAHITGFSLLQLY
jgi:hypothetical protein